MADPVQVVEGRAGAAASEAAAATASLSTAEASAMLDDSSKAEEDLLAELEDDDADFMASYREKRIAQLKQQQGAVAELQRRGHGEYTELPDEKTMLTETTTSARVVVHFYKEGFQRCRIMDKHMRLLADKHFGVRFFKLDVEKSPYLVAKLALKVLPTVMSFIDGKAVDRIVGFDMGGERPDDFPTELMERRLLQAGVFSRKTARRPGAAGSDSEHSSDED